MTSVNKSALVRHSVEKMYRLVSDVEGYPGFLPWCGGAEILSREEGMVVATVVISYGSLTKPFTTRNTLLPNESIEMVLEEGPFRSLHGIWRFHRLSDEASKIALDLEFEFSSRLVAATLGVVFNQITNTLVDAFVKKADEVYGKDG
ncbi:MAG: type II toxin-antitoxin system RatA family toxin [Gammaproteobacteria bacterium]|nr:type II toxin-antitoxin system RatA family toxin [Gammaproteobacteria bacterium]